LSNSTFLLFTVAQSQPFHKLGLEDQIDQEQGQRGMPEIIVKDVTLVNYQKSILRWDRGWRSPRYTSDPLYFTGEAIDWVLDHDVSLLG
jgi:hypothetical protein